MTSLDPTAAAARLVALDPAFEEVVAVVGPRPVRTPVKPAERFSTVIESIVSQLLSVKAADTIYARVVQACGGHVTSATISSLDHDELRATGLSNAKVRSMHEMARRVDEGLLNLAGHGRMSDEAVAAELVAVPGIGEWTAQMYLMFTLARPDVWPVGDLGVRNGWSILHGLDPAISAKDLRAEGELFSGMRSTAAMFCWQAVHVARGEV